MPPPSVPTFFLDCSLGRKKVRQGLIAAGARVEVHDDHFPSGTEDVVWLEEVGRRGWVVLTKDGKIRSRMLERIALSEARVHAFFLGNRSLSGDVMTQAFVKALPAIFHLIQEATEPLLVSVHRDGRITVIGGEQI